MVWGGYAQVCQRIQTAGVSVGCEVSVVQVRASSAVVSCAWHLDFPELYNPRLIIVFTGVCHWICSCSRWIKLGSVFWQTYFVSSIIFLLNRSRYTNMGSCFMVHVPVQSKIFHSYFCHNEFFFLANVRKSSLSLSLLALQPPSGVVFYSPLAGFSLLACKVSWSHTTTHHSR